MLRRMALRLDITYPDGETASFSLTADETILGRDPGVGITLPDAKASRRHAKVSKRGDGFWIEDLGSVNGLLLDGLPLGGQALLTPGSTVNIGDTLLVIADSDAPNASARATGNTEARYASPVGTQGRQGTRFALKVVEGELVGQTFVLDLEETIIGRGLDATVALDATSISRKHAVIRARDADSVSVEDLGSSNGTYVGELAVDGVTVLRVGEQIRFGTLVVELVHAANAPTQPVSAVAEPPQRANTTRPVDAQASEEPQPSAREQEDEQAQERLAPEGRPTFVDPPPQEATEATPPKKGDVFEQTTRAVPSPFLEQAGATPELPTELDAAPEDAPSEPVPEGTRPSFSMPAPQQREPDAAPEDFAPPGPGSLEAPPPPVATPTPGPEPEQEFESEPEPEPQAKQPSSAAALSPREVDASERPTEPAPDGALPPPGPEAPAAQGQPAAGKKAPIREITIC